MYSEIHLATDLFFVHPTIDPQSPVIYPVKALARREADGSLVGMIQLDNSYVLEQCGGRLVEVPPVPGIYLSREGLEGAGFACPTDEPSDAIQFLSATAQRSLLESEEAAALSA